MIVKIMNNGDTANKNTIKYIDCVGSIVVPKIHENCTHPAGGCDIVFYFDNGSDSTWRLNIGDKIYYLNNDGKTIDRDFRMCEEPQKEPQKTE